MKKMLIPLLMIFVAATGKAQTLQNPYPKTITVAGTAELEVVPDEIYVQVDLREYEKKGQGKQNIDKIKTEFLANARRIGVPDTAISIANYDAFNGNPWWRKKNRKDELYASISYQIKMKNSKQLDDLVNILDDEATQNFFIQRTSHSRLAEYRKQLKIAAVKAAKEKAQYLAAAIGEDVGTAVTINEPVEYYIPYYNTRASNAMMKRQEAADVAAPEENPVDFRKIKLKYDVTVVFALK
ncbi:MAG: SIMPL domain-containing protein [Flavisolibacter sp.]|nr:SIMPL domain-containing protein [Flavisolibacter sp.]MBD0377765.1 SIMPL domain-containing protein [Flavisolibacter sp.]